MEEIVENIPVSLYTNLSEKLVYIVLSTKDKNAVPAETAKEIIYLWRQDQLASPTGIRILINAASRVNAEATYGTMDELGLNAVTANLRVFNK
jgi:hypothetical protein